MVLDTAPILMALDIFVDRRVSALPVVNETGTCARRGAGWGAVVAGRGLWASVQDPGWSGGCFGSRIHYLASLCLSFLICELGILTTLIL